MTLAGTTSGQQLLDEGGHSVIRYWMGWLSVCTYILALACIIYFDDLQILGQDQSELPTIYNIRYLGIKVVDWIALSLFVLTVAYAGSGGRIALSPSHKHIGIILVVYCGAGLIGFAYSFSLQYDYVLWLQDFQRVIYMIGFFVITFHLIDSLEKWKLVVIFFLVFLSLKNILIAFWGLAGIGRTFGDWALRASQNSEFAYFPMMFFPLVVILLKGNSRLLKVLIVFGLFVYLFNSLIGIYRTVWVMLIFGSVYLLVQLDRKTRLWVLLILFVSMAATVGAISSIFPRFADLAWNFKFASIFEWSLAGNRSNATRILEVINVVSHVFSNFSFFLGMGLGAWWDDSTRSLLPDSGSGFMFKTRYHTTHMWYLTQLLKIGLIGLAFYWFAIYRMFTRVSAYIRLMSWNRWEKAVMLGLNIGLLCAFVSSAAFVRLFLVVGINLGLTAAFIQLDRYGIDVMKHPSKEQ